MHQRRRLQRVLAALPPEIGPGQPVQLVVNSGRSWFIASFLPLPISPNSLVTSPVSLIMNKCAAKQDRIGLYIIDSMKRAAFYSSSVRLPSQLPPIPPTRD